MTDRDYEVGYRKPPAHGRFRKGQSGNPKGRPKGKKNFLTELNEELQRKIIVQEGGKTKKLTKQAVIVKGFVRKAAEGDDRKILLLANLAQKETPDSRPPAREQLSEADRKRLARHLKRLAKNINESDDDAI